MCPGNDLVAKRSWFQFYSLVLSKTKKLRLKRPAVFSSHQAENSRNLLETPTNGPMRWFSAEHSSETRRTRSWRSRLSAEFLACPSCRHNVTRWTSLSTFLSFVFIAMFITFSPNNFTNYDRIVFWTFISFRIFITFSTRYYTCAFNIVKYSHAFTG